MAQKKSLARQIWDARWLYLLILPGVLYFVVWHYMPMEGILLAFKKYNARLGFWGSEWVGLKNFKRIFITPAAIKAILNTLRVSLSRLVIEFPAPIILALLLNEVVGKRFKKVLQTVYTFPHFLSWVVVSIIVSNFLSNAGFFNSLLRELGFESVNFLAGKALFRPLIYFTSIWKEVGWSSIIYMAAIANVDPALYEAAELDGAGRLQQAWHITVSGTEYPSSMMWCFMSIVSDDFGFMSPAANQDHRARLIEIYDTLEGATYVPYSYEYNFHSSELKGRYSVDIRSKITELVVGDTDIATGWDAFLTEYEKMVDPLVEELNTTYCAN